MCSAAIRMEDLDGRRIWWRIVEIDNRDEMR